MIIDKLIATGFILAVIIDTGITNENTKSEDEIFIMNRIGNILKQQQQKGVKTSHEHYPEFIEMLTKLWKIRQSNIKSQQEEDYKELDASQDYNPHKTLSTDLDELNADINMQLIESILNKEEIKNKRAYHRALCHFKICNMGTKRNGAWEEEKK